MQRKKVPHPFSEMKNNDLSPEQAVKAGVNKKLPINIIMDGLIKIYGLNILSAKTAYESALCLSSKRSQEDLGEIEEVIKNLE